VRRQCRHAVRRGCHRRGGQRACCRRASVAKGWKVAVIERAAVAGSAVKTAEITLPGFRHDLYAMNLSPFAGSPFFAAHKAALVKAGVELVPAARSFATAFPDGTWLGVESDLEATADRIAALNPGDAQRWRDMVAAFDGDAPHIFALLASPMPSMAALRASFGAWRAGGSTFVARLARLVLASPRNWLDENFFSEKLKVMMAAWGMRLDFAPDVAGGALFPYLESMANQKFGMVIGKNGADTIIAGMVRALEAAGGEVKVNAEAARVVTDSGGATAVELGGGERIEASRGVIANLNPRVLVRLLAPPPPAQVAMARLRPGPGTMMVHFALSDLPNWTAGAGLKSFAYVHLAPSFAAMARTYTEALAGMLPAEPVLVVGQPTAIDPGRAPPGKHVLWAGAGVADAYCRRRRRPHRRHRLEFRQGALRRPLGDLIERYAPGFCTKILGRTVLSPEDLERDNPNLVDGDSLSGSHHLDQNFLFRPAFGFSRYRSAVPRLYMVGASTWPGAGTGAGSGFMLAKALAGP
jgi:phytoene dehydrogenase-like protein